MLPMNWRMVDKWLGYWVFCFGVVGFVFKFGSNWSTFDVSTSILVCGGGVGSDIPVAYVMSSPTFISLSLLVRQPFATREGRCHIHTSCPGDLLLFPPSSTHPTNVPTASTADLLLLAPNCPSCSVPLPSQCRHDNSVTIPSTSLSRQLRSEIVL